MSEEKSGSGRPATIGVFFSGALFGVALGGIAGMILGRVTSAGPPQHDRYLEERLLVEPALQGDLAFKSVEFREYPSGGIYLIGTVPTAADKERLWEILGKKIGESRAHSAAFDVSVKPQPAPKSKSPPNSTPSN
jgi:hypothetical protein